MFFLYRSRVRKQTPEKKMHWKPSFLGSTSGDGGAKSSFCRWIAGQRLAYKERFSADTGITALVSNMSWGGTWTFCSQCPQQISSNVSVVHQSPPGQRKRGNGF